MSIVTLLEIAEGVYGDRIALGSRRDGTGVSYARLLGAARSLGARPECREAGHLAYHGANGPLLPTLLFGAACGSVPLVPLNFRLSAGQLGGLLGQLGPATVLADEAHRGLADRAGADTVRSAEELFEKALASAEELDSTEAPAAPPPASADELAAPPPAGDEAPAVLLFTSGTTSTPKAVVLRHRQLVAYVLQTVELASAEEEDAILVSVPPYHVAGIGTVLTNVYAGRRIVHLADFEPGRWLEVVRQEGITNAMVVPTMLARLVDFLDGDPAAVPTLRTLAYGGARMPPSVLERAMGAFIGVGFVNAYGLTETSSTIAVLGPEDHRAAFDAPDPAGAGSGRPGPRGRRRRGGGRPGRGALGPRAQVSGEYRGAGPVLDADGWFPTRDLARFDREGYLPREWQREEPGTTLGTTSSATDNELFYIERRKCGFPY